MVIANFSLAYDGMIHNKKDHFKVGMRAQDGVILERANAKRVMLERARI